MRVSGDAAEMQLLAWDSEKKLGVKGAIHVQANPSRADLMRGGRAVFYLASTWSYVSSGNKNEGGISHPRWEISPQKEKIN